MRATFFFYLTTMRGKKQGLVLCFVMLYSISPPTPSPNRRRVATRLKKKRKKTCTISHPPIHLSILPDTTQTEIHYGTHAHYFLLNIDDGRMVLGKCQIATRMTSPSPPPHTLVPTLGSVMKQLNKGLYTQRYYTTVRSIHTIWYYVPQSAVIFLQKVLVFVYPP